MLRITVELVPYGIEGAKRKIGEATVSKTNLGDLGNYYCDFKELDNNKEFVVELVEFDRSRGFWELLREALNKGVEENV